MRKRVLSFLLAASAAFCFVCSSAPEAHAIVPIGLVQSALASYVTSAGYKMWSENGGGDLMVEALSTLYQSWLDSTDPVGALTLGQMSEDDYVYLDTSGQIVIRKAAADMFQQFSDWMQTEYSVPVGSDTPTEVLAASGGSLSNADGTIVASRYHFSTPLSYNGTSYYLTPSIGTYSLYQNNVLQGTYPLYLGATVQSSILLTLYPLNSSLDWLLTGGASSSFGITYFYDKNGTYTVSGGFTPSADQSVFTQSSAVSSSTYNLNIPRSTSNPNQIAVSTLVNTSGGVAALGVTLAQTVADVVGQAKDDDAVVIGVGAGVGATAQDIADMVAQGVKAQTLDPSVSITAEAVIDTPVQPYPDIDGLGLPTLGAALVDRFPFCIPWDFVDTVKLLSADPQPINIKVDLIPQRIKTSVGITSDTSFDIDLSGEQYAKIGVFCRWGSLITFCFGLFLLTKRLVWTA